MYIAKCNTEIVVVETCQVFNTMHLLELAVK